MNKDSLDIITPNAIELLRQLITIPSLSKEENNTAACIENFLKEKEVEVFRLMNNVWACNKNFEAAKPTILLNSHHDTVPANAAYTRDTAFTAAGDSVNFTNTTTGASNFSWLINNVAASSSINFQHIFPTVGKFKITLNPQRQKVD